MNTYRSYFDRIQVSNTLHRKLLSGKKPEKRPAPAMVRYGAMAACFALICLGGLGLLRVLPSPVGGDVGGPSLSQDALYPGTKDTYGPGETPPPLATAGPAVPYDPMVLSPQQTTIEFVGVPLNFDGDELAARIAFPDGWFEEALTKKQMVYLLGGPEAADAPARLRWEGYDVTGKAIYDGTGKLWRAVLSGVARADDKNSFTLTLRPGALPEDCVVVSEEATVINGVDVQGSKGQYGWDDSGVMGETRKLTFMAGDVGVAFHVYHRSGERAEGLAGAAAARLAGLDRSIYLDRLVPAEIPAWRSETLTLTEARAEEGLGQYVPDFIPSGFAFENAHRELGQNRDYLSVFWSKGYDSVSVNIRRPFGAVAVMDVENRAYYDQRLYPVPHADSVPDEVLFGGFQDPIFRFADLTLDVLEARLAYVDNDGGDTAGHRGNFSVLYPDGVVVDYRLKGIMPQQVAKMLGI